MKKSFAVAILMVLVHLAGCASTGQGVDVSARIVPVINPEIRKAELAQLPRSERKKFCEEGFIMTSSNFDVTATISGPINRQRSSAQMAGNDLFAIIESWYFGSEGASENLRMVLREGAQMKAFTQIKPYSPSEYPGYNPMNEPIYQVANFLVPLAHAYLILEQEFPQDTVLLASVREWGDYLFKLTNSGKDDFVGKVGGIDRRVLIGQGWAHWGNATNNYEALEAAYRYYIHAVRSIGNNGADKVWHLIKTKSEIHEYVNMTYGAAMSTAFALVRSGASDVYTMKPGGGTLVEGISWIWGEISASPQSEYHHRKYRSPGSHSGAWSELFIHEFPDHQTSAKMRIWLDRRYEGSYGYTSGGGPTTCLYHKIK